MNILILLILNEQSEHSEQSEQYQLSLRTAILLGLSVPRSLKCLALFSCSPSRVNLPPSV